MYGIETMLQALKPNIVYNKILFNIEIFMLIVNKVNYANSCIDIIELSKYQNFDRQKKVYIY